MATQTAIDRLDEEYSPSQLVDSFASSVCNVLVRLAERDVPAACVDSVVRVAQAIAAKSSGRLPAQHGGAYVLHLWRRSAALESLLGGAFAIEERFALVELATLVCVERAWVGPLQPQFAPLRPPWWTFIDAAVAMSLHSELTRRWQEVIISLRSSAVDGVAQPVACSLAWCGMVDVERRNLGDTDLAGAAGMDRAPFVRNRVFGLRLLAQLFLMSRRLRDAEPNTKSKDNAS